MTVTDESPSTAAPVPGRPTPEWLGSARTAAITFALVVAAAFPALLYFGRRQWFFFDEWDFLVTRDGADIDDLLEGHNTHPSVIPIIVYRVVWQFVGLNHYVPYQALSILAHLAVAVLVREIMIRRCDVRPWTATIVVIPFVFLGTAWQNIVWAFQIGLVGSLIFGFIHLLLATHGGPVGRRDLLGVAAGLAALASSGVGVTTTVIVGLAVLLLRGWWPALVHTVPLALIFLAWESVWGPTEEEATRVWTSEMFGFVRVGYRETVLDFSWYTPVAIALVLLVVVGLVLAWARLDASAFRSRAAVPLAMAAGGVLFITIAAYGRAAFFGVDAAAASRYTHILTLSLLPAVAVALDALTKRWKVAAVVVIAVLAAGIVPNMREFHNRTRENLFLAGPETLVPAVARELALVPEFPDAASPIQNQAREITGGWLRQAVADGDVDLDKEAPGWVEDQARFRIELAVTQISFDDALTACEDLAAPLSLDLRRGDTFDLLNGTVTVERAEGFGSRRAPSMQVTSFLHALQLDAVADVGVVLKPALFPGAAPPQICR